MNVLLTSVGRRSYLVRYFRAALRGRGLVVAANCVPDAPGLLAADRSYVVPPAIDPEFIEALLRICREEAIGLLCSLHDWEAPFLAANIKRFESLGVTAVVSSPQVIEICLDKHATGAFCAANCLRFPTSWLCVADAMGAVASGRAEFPLIVKPRRGQGSIEVYTAETADELAVLYRMAARRTARHAANGLLGAADEQPILIQERIGGTEYGLDVVNDLSGRFVVAFVKRKLAMRAGETDVAVTVQSDALEAVGREIGVRLGHVGLLDVDVMVDAQGPCVLEMNPRFGGHYPFSHEAGADVPAALIAWAQGQYPDPRWLQIATGVKAFKDIAMVQPGELRMRGTP